MSRVPVVGSGTTVPGDAPLHPASASEMSEISTNSPYGTYEPAKREFPKRRLHVIGTPTSRTTCPQARLTLIIHELRYFAMLHQEEIEEQTFSKCERHETHPRNTWGGATLFSARCESGVSTAGGRSTRANRRARSIHVDAARRGMDYYIGRVCVGTAVEPGTNPVRRGSISSTYRVCDGLRGGTGGDSDDMNL